MVKETHSKSSSVTLEELKTLIIVLTGKVGENTVSLVGLDKKIEKNTVSLVELDKKVDQNTVSLAELDKKVGRNIVSLAELDKKIEGNYKELKERDLKFEKEFSKNIKEIGETHTYIFNQLSKLDRKSDKLSEKLAKRMDNMNNLLETSVKNLMQGNRERFFMKAHLEGNDKRITRLERKTNLKKAGLRI